MGTAAGAGTAGALTATGAGAGAADWLPTPLKRSLVSDESPKSESTLLSPPCGASAAAAAGSLTTAGFTGSGAGGGADFFDSLDSLAGEGCVRAPSYVEYDAIK